MATSAPSSAVTEQLWHIRKTAGISARDVAQILGTDESVVADWLSGSVAPRSESCRRIREFEALMVELSAMYEKPADARRWLFAPHPQLHGDTPASRIQQGKNGDVRAVIAAFMEGAYV